MNTFDLSGRVAIVTGANGGIGLGIARGLLAAGAKVLLTGRDPQKNQRTEAALATAKDRVRMLAVDLNDEDGPARMAAAALEQFGRIDILVNNAGTNRRKPPQDYTADEFRFLVDTNLTSVFRCCQAVHPAFLRNPGGKIINIGSMMSIFGAPFAVPYAATKGAVVQLSKALATAWADDQIQVNAILPGWIDTELTIRARQDVPTLHDRVLARTPAGRWGRPEDLAGTAVFLASAASDFVSGVAIPVDGGYAAQG